jgi:hypothetical protein
MRARRAAAWPSTCFDSSCQPIKGTRRVAPKWRERAMATGLKFRSEVVWSLAALLLLFLLPLA